ncbi:MAG TPA: hypothetical protein DCE23_06375 [Firmicutes bacterium]|nr:hypothetical protein [Bacillota bacterium]
MSSEETNNQENNVGLEMPAVSEAKNEEVSMEVTSQAEQINQSNNVLPEQNVNSNPMPQPVQSPYVGQQQVGNVPNNEKKKLDVKVIVAIAVVAVIFLVLIFMLISGSGSKGKAKKFAKYWVKGDSQKIVELYHEDFVDKQSTGSKKDFKDEFKDTFKDRKDDDIVFKGYKIIDKYVPNKNLLDDYKENIEKYYDIDEKDVKAVNQYLVKFKYEEDGDKKVDYEQIITVKVKGKWYVFSTIM